MAQQWFLVRDGQEIGPLSPAELKQRVAKGVLRPDDLIRREDMKTPRKASSVKGLFAEPKPAEVPVLPPSDPIEYQKSKSRRVPLKIMIPVSVSILFLCCGGFGIVTYIGGKEASAARADMAEGDRLWESGDKEGGAAKYRAIIDNFKAAYIKEPHNARLYGRVIDFEYEKNNRDGAKRLLDKALEKGITPNVSASEAKAVIASIQAEKDRFAAGKQQKEEQEKLSRLPVTNLDWDNASKFLDDTKSYKGRKLRVKVHYDGGGFRRGSANTLISLKGMVLHKSGDYDISFEIPEGTPQPNVQPGDILMVTFVCNEGTLHSGNTATKIERP